MEELKELTRKDIVKATGAMPYQVKYLSDCGMLPIIRDAKQRGDPIIYAPGAVQIVKEFLERKSHNSES